MWPKDPRAALLERNSAPQSRGELDFYLMFFVHPQIIFLLFVIANIISQYSLPNISLKSWPLLS